MWIRTNKKMMNLNTVCRITCDREGVMSKGPCITFLHNEGKYCPIHTEVSYPDYPTAERWFDELHKAIKADVPIFDMR